MSKQKMRAALSAVLARYREHPDFLLCESFDDIDTPGQLSGDTVLHIAIRSGDEAEVQRLLDLDASPNCAGDLGMTALHYAASFSSPTMVRLLRKAGANAELTNEWGQTPLYLVKLMAKGSDISEMERALTCPLSDL